MKMSEITALFCAVCLAAALVFLSGCASTPPNRERDAVNAANAAVEAMK
ncbi:hypothetical protein FACS1894137_01520 [Spirochaetia bacterium]|nr:hypothetical protein FACS1894137_01520 [Spirochaetia bacterium]